MIGNVTIAYSSVCRSAISVSRDLLLSLEGLKFMPKFGRNGLLSESDRLGKPFGTADTDYRRSDTRVSQGKLQRSCRERYPITLTDGFHLLGARQQRLRGILIHIARIGTWSLRQDSTAVGRGIHGGYPVVVAHIPERVSLGIEQGVPVMRDGYLEYPCFNKLSHEINRAASHAEMGNQALLLAALERFDRSANRHGLLKRRMFRVVEIEQLQLVQAKQPQAALDTASHLPTAEIT